MEQDPFLTAASPETAHHQASMILETMKLEAREMSVEQAEIVTIGALRTPENAHLWNNGEKTISLARRLESGEVSQAEVAEAETLWTESYVTVAEGAAKRCIDGSTVVGYIDSDPAHYGKGLGPQIQGGTADEAYAMRLNNGFDNEPNATLLDDMDVIAAERSDRFAPGDHTDDKNIGNPDNCGCGAANGHASKADLLINDEPTDLAVSLLGAVYEVAGSTPPSDRITTIRAHAAELRARPNYFPAHVIDVIKKIEQLNPNGVETLVRPHNEIILGINLVPNTTFHRDHFNAATDSKLQAFNLDAWYILEEYGEDGYALLLDSILTAMELTDGTLIVKVRKPKQADYVQAA